jgi:hypothetical protein
MSYEIVLGSLGPVFPLTLTANDGTFTLEDDDTVTLRYVDPDGETHEVEMEITSATDGEVEYTWVDGDLPSVGVYKGQVTVERALDATFPRIFPSNGQRVLWWVQSAI